ncbi:MAG: methyl-accepting chemotaxis protein [Negativicutes bacterium]|nr:methyl-accepting chemotaxis protein [Negativicutes bacterium]
MSIRTKMVLIFSVVSAIILLVASATGYYFTKNRLSENIEKQMTATINSHINKLDGWLIAKTKVVEITASTMQSAAGDGEVPVSLLMGYRNMDKELSDVYYGSLDGKMVDGSGWVPPSDFDPRTRVWFKKALEQKKLVFTDPYLDAATKQMAVAVALPYEPVPGQIRGVVSADILLQTLVENVKKISLDGQGYAFLIDSRGFILAHPDSEVISKNIFEVGKLKDLGGAVKEIIGKETGYRQYQEDGKDMIMVYRQIPSTQWTLGITVEQAIVFQSLAYLRWLFIAITLVSILVVIAVTFAVARRITRPLEHLEQRVGLLASGNLTVQAEVTGNDEFSRLSGGFNRMVGDLRTMVNDISGSTLDLKNSSNKLVDIAANVAANSQEMSATIGMVSAAVEQISAGTEENAGSAEQVNYGVEAVAKMAKQMAAAAKEAAQASEGVASEVKEVSAVIEEVSQSISQVATFAQEVAASCQRSIVITAEARSRSQETNDIIHKLSVSSKQINKIVDIIRNIAEQTNMLALNATIEAAGAGDAGRGFAVVAGEVKELSKRTAEEAGRIGRQIEDMQNDMGEAVVMVGKIGDVIAETMNITQTIASAVSEESQNMAVAADGAAAGKNRVTTISKEVAAIADKTGQVSKNAAKAASGVEALFHTTAEMALKADEVARSTDEMGAAMNNISESTQEIAKGTQEISQSIQETDKAIVDTAAKASTVSECAHDVGELANRLQELVGRFKV